MGWHLLLPLPTLPRLLMTMLSILDRPPAVRLVFGCETARLADGGADVADEDAQHGDGGGDDGNDRFDRVPDGELDGVVQTKSGLPHPIYTEKRDYKAPYCATY